MRQVIGAIVLLFVACRESPTPPSPGQVATPEASTHAQAAGAAPADASQAPDSAESVPDTRAPMADIAPVDASPDTIAPEDIVALRGDAALDTSAPDAPSAAVEEVLAPPTELRDLATWCRGRESRDECRIPMNATLGFSRDGGSLTMLVRPWEPSCFIATADAIAVASLPDLRAVERVEIGWQEDAPVPYERAMRQGWSAIRKAVRGLVPARNLVAERDEAEAGVRLYYPRATLGPPYAGWRVLVAARTGIIKIRPRGARDPIEIGALAGGVYPSVEEVTLSPDERWLVLTLAWHDGGHCGSTSVERAVFPWPPVAVAPASPDGSP